MTNIALIVLDTLRKDAFDEHFDWLPGKRFENAWSTSHWTVPAHASLFTGQYASEAGVYRNAETLDVEGDVLPELLKKNGYTTRAFSANPNISRQFKFDRGFNQFEGSWRLKSLDSHMFDWDTFIAKTMDMGPQRYILALWECLTGDYNTIPSIQKGIHLKLRDLGYGQQTVDDGAASALDFVQRTKFGRNEFLFMNLMEAHSPYSAPAEYQTVEPPEISGLEATFDKPRNDSEKIRQAYHDEVRYLSDMYRKIFEELRVDFDYIITVSDHGELLGEHGAWEHMYGIYPELTHVPIVISNQTEETSELNQSVNLLDVHGTILEIAKIEHDYKGRDLRSELKDGELLTEYHGISNRHYHSLKNRGFEDIEYLNDELNGLVNGGYYGHETFEEFNEYGYSPYDNARDRLEKLVDNLQKRVVEEDEDVGEEILEQLKDLGYA